jgi:hypothetical protein
MSNVILLILLIAILAGISAPVAAPGGSPSTARGAVSPGPLARIRARVSGPLRGPRDEPISQRDKAERTDQMICPHCNRTIRQEERYLMSTDAEAKWPKWAVPAMWLLLFLAVVATLTLFSHAAVS